MTATNDSDELEALFDSIAANNQAHDVLPQNVQASVPPLQAKVASPTPEQTQMLKNAADSVNNFQKNSALTVENNWNAQENVFNQLGQMTRILHDTLRKLGYDKMLEKSIEAMPDTKARLEYVANLTEQAACKVLNATDTARPVLDSVNQTAQGLSHRWAQLFANQLDAQGLRQLSLDTQAFLSEELPQKNAILHKQLNEMMMAQDFQDLTGQVIKKIIEVAQELESSLMSVLLQVVPDDKKTPAVNHMLQGPVIKSQGRTDVVVNQEQVDELLANLGF